MVSKARLKTLWNKISKDNIGVLASIVAWNTLTSLVPIVIGLLAISGLILRGNSSMQQSVVTHLSVVLKGVLSPAELNRMVQTSTHHSGLLGIIAFLAFFGVVRTSAEPFQLFFRQHSKPEAATSSKRNCSTLA